MFMPDGAAFDGAAAVDVVAAVDGFAVEWTDCTWTKAPPATTALEVLDGAAWEVETGAALELVVTGAAGAGTALAIWSLPLAC